ncbi:MAG: cation:proton antiporter [Betaproteobacteria bacterium]|nr:cation:proton antiporter [Betaproteobacteria bacterium]
MHDLAVITMLAGALAAALVFGWITQRLGLTTLVGYMVAGILVGPHTPGFVADARLATQMAEIGVILLMFGVGMHFHPQELLRVWRIAVPGAVAQSAVAAVAGWACARWFGWGNAAGVVFGMALAVASTVVLMRMLVDRDRLATRAGHVAVGWLIVEDLFTVVALVVLPVLATDAVDAKSLGMPLLVALGKAAAFAALVALVGGRVVGGVMERMARTRSEELFTLAVFVLALGIAIIAAEGFQVSVALGAFIAGLVVGQSRFGPQASGFMTPFRDVFSALFFVSVGMLFDPGFVLREPLLVAAALAIVLVVKPLVALAIVKLIGDERGTAATVAVGLAQIGEFSFILATLGRGLGILPPEALDALVAAAIFSIALNPVLFRLLAQPQAEPPPAAAGLPVAAAADAPAPVAGDRTVAIVGTGELTRRIVLRCAANGIGVVVVGDDLPALDAYRAQGIAVVYGNAARADVLRAAHVEHARAIVVADAALADKMAVCIAARSLNPRLAIVATAGSDAERAWLREFGVMFVCDALDGLTDAVVRSLRQAL